MLGLMPCHDMLIGTPEPSPFERFRRHYTDTALSIGSERTVLGSDFNGGIGHLPELPHVGEVGRFWQRLRESGAPVPPRLDDTVEVFLSAWERAQRG
jgi:microsomal dipeptidase-like Zn-dependent dipeptidase